MYNRSSLALDTLEDPDAAWPQPMPHLISRRYAVAAGAPEPLIWKGLDTLSFKRDRKSSVVSFIIHTLVIAVILWWGMTAHTHVIQTAEMVVTPMHFTLYTPPPPPQIMPVAKISGGGGGGGAHQVVEPTQGHVPKVARIQTLPPQIVRVANPKLAVEPTMQVNIPSSSPLPNLGMAQSPQIALASQGSGSGSGFGHGMGGGIGASQGSGAGAGSGGGYGGGLMSVGGGVSAPVLIHSVEPEFTDQARQGNYTGTVSIQLIVDSQGTPQDVRVVHHLGMGLDEKAIAAVRQYRFRPATYQGHPVAVQMIVEVDFRLH
ncbi:MAG TPA: energy transducer TonB [Terracidiphilus sp.]|jgi:TonB family protein